MTKTKRFDFWLCVSSLIYALWGISVIAWVIREAIK